MTRSVKMTEITNVDTITSTIKVAITKKKIVSNAAVIPLVNTSNKKVFIKIVKGNANKSIEATRNALKGKKIDSFEGHARSFVKEQGFDKLTVWTSRVAKVQVSRIAKSAANQIAFWNRCGFEVVNKEDFIKA